MEEFLIKYAQHKLSTTKNATYFLNELLDAAARFAPVCAQARLLLLLWEEKVTSYDIFADLLLYPDEIDDKFLNAQQFEAARVYQDYVLPIILKAKHVLNKFAYSKRIECPRELIEDLELARRSMTGFKGADAQRFPRYFETRVVCFQMIAGRLGDVFNQFIEEYVTYMQLAGKTVNKQLTGAFLLDKLASLNIWAVNAKGDYECDLFTVLERTTVLLGEVFQFEDQFREEFEEPDAGMEDEVQALLRQIL